MRGILTIVALLFTVGAALAQEAPAGPPYRVGGEVTRPEKVSGDPPAYTEMARRARISGVLVKVELLRHKASSLVDDEEAAQALRDEADLLDKRVYELRVKKQPEKGT